MGTDTATPDPGPEALEAMRKELHRLVEQLEEPYVSALIALVKACRGPDGRPVGDT